MERLTAAQQGHLAMLLFSAVVAGSFSLGAQVANDIAPLALNAVRFWMAAAVLAVVIAKTNNFDRRMFLAPWRYAVLGALFGTYFVLMFEGLKTAPPVSMSAVFTLTPVLSAIFGWILLRQITTARMAFALAVGATGALWVIFRADLIAFLTFSVGRGEVIFFAGCLCHAIYTPMVRKLNRGEPALVFAFATLLGGGVVLTCFGWQDIWGTEWNALPAMVWITLIYIAVFASSLSTWLLQSATMHLPSAKVMAYTYLVPSWVICWEFMMGNGLPAPLVLGGVLLTVFALGILLRDEESTK